MILSPEQSSAHCNHSEHLSTWLQLRFDIQCYPESSSFPSHPHNSDPPSTLIPPEIVRIIVGEAATACLQTTLALTLVSKTVRGWVEPILYHTVVLWTPHTLQLFRAAFDTKPPSFFATHVRNLFINGEDGADIILACSRVQRLAAYPPVLLEIPNSDDEDEHALTLPQCRAEPGCPLPEEVMLMGFLEDVPWASRLFLQVKYLYIGLEPPTPETACDLSLLPSLTHCAFPYDGEDDDALLLTISTLLESTTLSVLVILVNDEQGNPDRDHKGCIWTKLACMADDRLLVGTESNLDGDDWVTMVNEGTSLWAPCEEEFKDWRSHLN